MPTNEEIAATLPMDALAAGLDVSLDEPAPAAPASATKAKAPEPANDDAPAEESSPPAEEKPNGKSKRPKEPEIEAAKESKPDDPKAQKRRRVVELDREWADARRASKEARTERDRIAAEARELQAQRAELDERMRSMRRIVDAAEKFRDNPHLGMAEMARAVGRNPDDAFRQLLERQAHEGNPGPGELLEAFRLMRDDFDRQLKTMHQRYEAERTKSTEAQLATQNERHIRSIIKVSQDEELQSRYPNLAKLHPERLAEEAGNAVAYARKVYHQHPELLDEPGALLAALDREAAKEIAYYREKLSSREAGESGTSPPGASAQNGGRQAAKPAKPLSNANAADGSSRGASAASRNEEIERIARRNFGLD